MVAGSDERGAFYGLQSLKQLLASGGRSLQVPGASATGPTRLFGASVYVPGRANIPYFRRFIREVMALYKFNTLMMEMSGCMRLDRHPEVNAAGWNSHEISYSRRGQPPRERCTAANRTRLTRIVVTAAFWRNRLSRTPALLGGSASH